MPAAILNKLITRWSGKALTGNECDAAYISAIIAAFPSNDSLIMFLIISSFSLKDRFSICTSD